MRGRRDPGLVRAIVVVGAPHNEDGNEVPGIIAGKAYLMYGRPAVDWGMHYPLSLADIIHIGKPEVGVLPRLVHSRFGLHVVEVLARHQGSLAASECSADSALYTFT